MVERATSRRGFLKYSGIIAGAVALAGCGGDGGDPTPTEDGGGPTPTEDGASPTSTDTDTATATERPPVAPTVAFQFEYDPDAGAVTITHVGGDAVVPSRLYVRGEGFADASGADMTAAGQWAGAATYELEGEPAVVSGDAVTVGVTADHEIAVVWEPPEADVAKTLAVARGPEA